MKIGLIILTLYSQISWANIGWMESAELITPESDMQKLIDKAVKEIFAGPLHSDLCTVFTDAGNIYYSIGLSQQTAVEIADSCSTKKQNAGMSKYNKKSYFLVKEAFANLDSWTDSANRTFIFTDQELNYEKLKSIILHEIVIAVDGKANMVLTTYMSYKAIIKDRTARIIHVATSKSLNDEENTLRKAFNLSTWNPISLTFAAMRAFDFEARNNKKKYIQNHQQCVDKFKAIYAIIKNIPDFKPQAGIDALATTSIAALVSSSIDAISTTVSQSNAPSGLAQENENLNSILNQDLIIEDLDNNNVSFCEFMAQPLIINRTLYTFFSRGPRPRTTGGVDD